MNEISPEQLPNRAFQLAYFLHCDQKTATEIATRALNKLQLAATAQSKRLYYRLTGRLSGREDLRKARSKVSLGEPHLLQRLVYVESEEYERRKEAAAQAAGANAGTRAASQNDLVVFFIKHLVRITTKRNSFYVTLGLSRLLYNYTTPETMELYNLVIQDPDRVHDDYYYRSRKGVLLKEMKERFGVLIEVVKGTRGEQRWQAGADLPHHSALVRECLYWFTPWETLCVVPEQFDPLSDSIAQLNFHGRLADEEHEVEVNRIHAVLHPKCLAHLAAANQLAAPDQRLELPHFFVADDYDDSNGSSRQPPDLSADDLRTINDLLAHEASRRKAARVSFFRVLVDGTERAEINAAQSKVAHLRVDEDAEVIEVYSADQEGPLLLATHLLSFNGAAAQSSVITIESGEQIAFTTQLLRDEAGATTGADITVTRNETAPFRSTLRRIRGILSSFLAPASDATALRWKPAAAFAVLALFCLGAGWLWSSRQSVRPEIVYVAPTPAPTLAPGSKQSNVPEPDATAEPGKRISPASTPANNATPDHRATVASPELAANGSKQERDESFVERAIVPDAGGDMAAGESEMRSRNREVMGKPLNEVERLYVQALGGNAANQLLTEELRRRLAQNGRLLFSDIDTADAALKVSARPASARRGDKRVIATVRAVNANGYVVWPVTRRASSMRYVGLPNYVAERLVADLSREIENAKRRAQ